MAKHSIRRGWIRLLEFLRIRRRPEIQETVPVEVLPSSAAFLRFLPEDSTAAQANAAEALELLFSLGQLPGSDEQHWLVDQLLRKLTGEAYDGFVEFYSVDESFGIDFGWELGTKPRPKDVHTV